MVETQNFLDMVSGGRFWRKHENKKYAFIVQTTREKSALSLTCFVSVSL